MTKLLSATIAVLLIAGCSSPKLLPDGGPTTNQIINGAYYGELHSGEYKRNPRNIVSGYSMSSRTSRKLQDLNEDFKSVPNPQLIGYVAPHFSSKGQMPVPGYFTMFRLYKKDEYALMREDASTGVSR